MCTAPHPTQPLPSICSQLFPLFLSLILWYFVSFLLIFYDIYILHCGMLCTFGKVVGAPEKFNSH